LGQTHWIGVGGFWLGGTVPPAEPTIGTNPNILASNGSGGSIAWADPDIGLSAAICHNRMFRINPPLPAHEHPFTELGDLVRSLGVENGDEVRFPLSPSVLLVLTRGDADPSNASLRMVNAEICKRAHQFVVARPEHLSKLDQLALPRHPPRMHFRLIERAEGELVHMWTD
jgi:hypothetical protein